MSEAYASTLDISFDVRGGLLMRQIHHWAALLFVARCRAHVAVFFTGAFRKPRELNWVIGSPAAHRWRWLAGFTGYSLPDDLLSGTGLRIAEGIMLAIPVVGTYLSFFLFGGEFPGTDIIPGSTSSTSCCAGPDPGADHRPPAAGLVPEAHPVARPRAAPNDNVVGYPLFPVYVAKAGGFFFVVFGTSGADGRPGQINPVWMYGPYNPTRSPRAPSPTGTSGLARRGLRLMPNWEIVAFGFTLSWNVLIPALIVPGIMFTALALYPWIEAWITGDKREHHLLDRPRNAVGPVRTRPSAWTIRLIITFYGTRSREAARQGDRHHQADARGRVPRDPAHRRRRALTRCTTSDAEGRFPTGSRPSACAGYSPADRPASLSTMRAIRAARVRSVRAVWIWCSSA
jgi:ubiquinol-cytochrome c reductase cytochrome b subunit